MCYICAVQFALQSSRHGSLAVSLRPFSLGGFAHNIPVIEEDLIQQTNIPQKDLEILEELQLAAYSVPIYCRK